MLSTTEQEIRQLADQVGNRISTLVQEQVSKDVARMQKGGR